MRTVLLTVYVQQAIASHEDDVRSKLANQGFSYPPFSGRDREVRLVRPRSDNETKGSSLELKVFNLDDDPVYRALSYTWGDIDNAYGIFVNEQEFFIRSNLYDYLSQLSHDGEPCPWYFIDAICIDQRNVSERNIQVALMGEIYSKVALVESWLGVPDEYADEDNGNEACYDEESEPRQKDDDGDDDDDEYEDDDDRKDGLRIFEVSNQRLYLPQGVTVDADGLLQLGLTQVVELEKFPRRSPYVRYCRYMWIKRVFLDIPYWTRLWIVQEVLQARSVHLRAGPLKLDLRELQRWFERQIQDVWGPEKNPADRDRWSSTDHYYQGMLWDDVKQSASHSQVDEHPLNRVIKFLFKSSDWLGQGRSSFPLMDFTTAVKEFSNQACSERRDKIFGLLGLVDSLIEVDYLMPLFELYVRALAEGAIALGERYLYEWRWEQNDDVGGTWDQWALDWKDFVAPLNMAFGFQPWHPLTGLATSIIVEQCLPFPPRSILRDVLTLPFAEYLRYDETVLGRLWRMEAGSEFFNMIGPRTEGADAILLSIYMSMTVQLGFHEALNLNMTVPLEEDDVMTLDKRYRQVEGLVSTVLSKYYSDPAGKCHSSTIHPRLRDAMATCTVSGEEDQEG